MWLLQAWNSTVDLASLELRLSCLCLHLGLQEWATMLGQLCFYAVCEHQPPPRTFLKMDLLTVELLGQLLQTLRT